MATCEEPAGLSPLCANGPVPISPLGSSPLAIPGAPGLTAGLTAGWHLTLEMENPVSQKSSLRAGKMAQWVKGLAAKLDNLALIPRTHTIRESRLPKVVL